MKLTGWQMYNHIAIKLTESGGPEPQKEIRRIYDASQDDENGTSWIATRKPGASFCLSPNSQLLVFTLLPKAEALVLTAKIVDRQTEMPSALIVRELYGHYSSEFEAFWEICDAKLTKMTISKLPGITLSGKSLVDAFSGQLSFAYWIPNGKSTQMRMAAPKKRQQHSQPAKACSQPNHRILNNQFQGTPAVPLHGVDFSGAREVNGRNRKLWIASWHPGKQFVSLKCGGEDPGFDRNDVTKKILKEGGLWVIDFPFGPPKQVAIAAGWKTWQDYLKWCSSNESPTELRNELRTTLKSANANWSIKRKIDIETQAWFPFFEQLYRQTITGGRDVLFPIDAENRQQVSVLPFHDVCEPTFQQSIVIEGYPKWTLKQMGLPMGGYKNQKCPEIAHELRAKIVSGIRQNGIPIRDNDIARAVGDIEGDAVDALVLLHAARCSICRKPTEWTKNTWPVIEGWYFD